MPKKLNRSTTRRGSHGALFLRKSFWLLAVAGMGVSPSLHAQELPTTAQATTPAAQAPAAKNTTVSLGTSHFTRKYDRPGGQHKYEGWATTLGLSHKLDEAWRVGGSLTAVQTSSSAELNSNKKDLHSWTPRVFATWTNRKGLFVTGDATHGNATLDNTRLSNNRSVFYQSNTKTATTSLEVAQYFPITQNLWSGIAARYTRTYFREREYIDPVGGNSPSRTENWGTGTVRAVASYLLGDFTPFVAADFNQANKEIIAGSGDRNFYGYNLGVTYTVTSEAALVLGYGGTTGISNLTDRRYTASVSYRF